MMTALQMAVCVAVFSDLAAAGNKAYRPETHKAIAENICAAANKEGFDPRLLGAYILTENEKFNIFESRKAVRGEDLGLYQSNSAFQGHRANFDFVYHPYYATQQVVAIVREHFSALGNTWQAIAAYHSPERARRGEPSARRYYERWLSKYQIVEKKFDDATRFFTRYGNVHGTD